jgi:glycerol-3-phosphate acyltransferase PlsY
MLLASDQQATVIHIWSILLAAAYLMGSLPFSVWLGKIFFSTDVREHGSGNAGATNTWRVLGWKAGLPVLILDIGKGYASTLLPQLIISSETDPDLILWMRIACGVCAAGGHIYPVFAGFRGGKAVATLLGIVLGLMPVPALCSLGVFLITFTLFRYVSLGSLSAAVSIPFFVYGLIHPISLPLLLFSILITGLVVMTHLKNLGRLLRGEESRVLFFRENR